MEKQLQDKLNAINTVISLIDNLEFKKTLFELSLSLIKETIKETNKSNVSLQKQLFMPEEKAEENIYLKYTTERIIKEPTISENRLTISKIKDDFKKWYIIHCGVLNGINTNELKIYLINKFGKYPSNGWNNISLSEEEI